MLTQSEKHTYIRSRCLETKIFYFIKPQIMELSDSIVRNSYIYRFVSLNCCVNLNKFPSVPLSGSSCAAVSLTRSKRRSRRRELPPSMETPPDGYRRNVGICLVNPSKKVINFALFHLNLIFCFSIKFVTRVYGFGC